MELIQYLHAFDVTQTKESARSAEELGFDVIHTVEGTADSFLPLTLAAVATQRLKLGNAVAAAFGRSPYVTANLAWDLQRLSQGRFELGIGPQVRRHVEDRLSSQWRPPGPRLRDYVECIRAIFRTWQHGEDPAYVGKYYRFKWRNPHFDAGPIDFDSPKILISAVNDFMVRMAGETCDGILLHPLSSPKYVTDFVRPRVDAGHARRVDGGRCLLSGANFVGVGRDEEGIAKVRETIRSTIGFYGSTGAYRVMFDVHGWGALADDLRQISLERRWDDMHVPDEVVDTIAIISTPEDLASAVVERWGGVVDRFAFLALAADMQPDEWRDTLSAIKAATVRAGVGGPR